MLRLCRRPPHLRPLLLVLLLLLRRRQGRRQGQGQAQAQARLRLLLLLLAASPRRHPRWLDWALVARHLAAEVARVLGSPTPPPRPPPVGVVGVVGAAVRPRVLRRRCTLRPPPRAPAARLATCHCGAMPPRTRRAPAHLLQAQVPQAPQVLGRRRRCAWCPGDHRRLQS